MLLTATSLLFFFFFLFSVCSIYRRLRGKGKIGIEVWRLGRSQAARPTQGVHPLSWILDPAWLLEITLVKGASQKASFAMQRSGYTQNGVCWTLGPGEYFSCSFFFIIFFFISYFKRKGVLLQDITDFLPPQIFFLIFFFKKKKN